MEVKKEMAIKKEFKVNELISLKLQWDPLKKRNETVIYVGEKLFRQCKYLFLILPYEELDEEIDSIDEAAQKFNDSLHDDGRTNKFTPEDFGLTEEEVFWGHASNLQAWAENDYDTRLLHSNLSFPLLKKLAEIGDLRAKKRFNDEAVYRYSSGSAELREFLYEEGYLNFFTKEEVLQLSVPEDQYIALKKISEELNRSWTQLFSIREAYSGTVWTLKLYNIDAIPRSILLLKDTLTKLAISFKDGAATEIPEWFCELECLKWLEIGGPLACLSESFGKLKSLKHAELYLKLTSIPEGFGDLANLRRLTLNYNRLTSLPASFKNLTRLYYLNLKGNRFKVVPEVLSDMENLGSVGLDDNPIPESIMTEFISSAERVHSGIYKIKNTKYYI